MSKILVVEDEEELMTILALALRRGGYEVFTARDGLAGLPTARAQMPDLVISDVMMPRMTGRELLMALRADPATATLPFIIMTGRPDETSMRQGMQLGADDYLPKPFDVPEVLAAVRIRLERHQLIRDRVEAKASELRANLRSMLPHELLTPLSGILGFADLMTTEYESLQPSDILEMATVIQQSGDHLLRLAHNFLLAIDFEDMTRDPVRKQSFKPGRTANVRAAITTAAEGWARKRSRADDLSIELADGAVAVGDDLCKKIVEELLDNAFKFSPKGSSVRVSSVVDAAGYALSVQDQGRGLTPQQIVRIGAWQQFDRRLHEQQGLGLGLVVIQRVVEAHGGSLTLESEIAIGTTVTVRLPVG